MAEDIKSNDIEKQTSVGTYILKQLYQQTVLWGSMIGGTYAGLMASKPFFKATEATPEIQRQWKQMPGFIRKIPGLGTPMSGKQLAVGGGVGLFVGSLLGGITLGYEHWKKIKQSQLQVDEITKDISEIEVFKKTDPELKAENERLWTELKKRDAAPAATMVEKVGGQKKESWKEAATASTEQAMEASR